MRHMTDGSGGEIPRGVWRVYCRPDVYKRQTYTFTYTINAIPVFPVAVILIRRLFKKCNNPYIPGIIAGILLCWLQVSCSFTLHADMYYGPAAAFLP